MTLKPGFHKMPDPQYFAHSAINNSILKIIQEQSPAHGKDAMDNPSPSTPAQEFGSGLHAYFEDENHQAFHAAYYLNPEGNGATKAVKEARAQAKQDNPGKKPISVKDFETIKGMAESLEAHPVTKHLVYTGDSEIVGLYTDQETGIECKVKYDLLRQDIALALDWKSTTSGGASPATAPKNIFNFSYHQQAAMYSDAFFQITGEKLKDWLFVFIEKIRPYAVGVYRLDDQALALGMRQYRAALRTYAECMATGQWPGYSDRIESVSLPAWAFNKTDSE
jgi:ATP-dependent exoDNAse (exonuclease V) beta subunit